MRILSYRRFALWWQLAMDWFQSQFAAIQTALTDLDVDVDLSGVAKQDTLLEQSNPYNHPNLFYAGIGWYAATDILQGDYQIFKRIGVPHENDAPEYLGFRWREKVGIYGTYFYYPAVGQTVYYASTTEVYIDRPYPSTISQVKTVRLSKVLDLIGTPASGQQSTLFGALGNINFSQLKDDLQGTDPTVTLTAIYEYLAGQTPEDIPEGLGDRINLLLQFFGLPQALPEFTYATEQEVKDINDDVMGALYGYGMVTVTIHSLMRTGAETTQDLASVIYVDPEKTWAENGFPTLYDDEGTAIDTTTNPAAGDEVFNYQIQSES